MTILVRCPNPKCANHAAGKPVPDHLAGTTIRCKLCGQGAHVPGLAKRANSAAHADEADEGSKSRLLLFGGIGAAAVLLVALGVAAVMFLGGSNVPPQGLVAANGNTSPQTPDKPPSDPVTPVPVTKPTTATTPTTPGENPKPGTTTPTPKVEPEKTPKEEESKISRLIPFEKIEGFDKLEKVKIFQIKGTAKFAKTPNLNDLAIAWHSNTHFKFTENVNNPGNKLVIMTLLKDSQAWVKIQGLPMGLVQKQLFGKEQGDIQNEAFGYIFSNLALLKEKDREFDFVPDQDVLVKGRECFSIRAARKGFPEMHFYFDKRSNRVVKVQYKIGVTLFETFYSDYQETNGIFYWRTMEQHRNGQPHAVFTINTIQFLNQFEESMFSLN